MFTEIIMSGGRGWSSTKWDAERMRVREREREKDNEVGGEWRFIGQRDSVRVTS